LKRLSHPAGIILPFDRKSDADLIIPEVRSAICTGAYCASILRLLTDAVRAGDRVLVIGAGLGVVSTLVAQSRGVERVIAVEANILLVPYLERVHALNGVPWVETVNAVLGDSGKGRVPLFARRDIRYSSLLPTDQPWQQVMMVPSMDLNVILTEEQITVIVCNIPAPSAQLLGRAKLGPIERILEPDVPNGRCNVQSPD
jgi:FkbM family methyltransferase